MNPQNFSRGPSYFTCGSQQQSNQRNWYNENDQQRHALQNNNEHLDGRTYRKIIIPKGSIQSNQTAVIRIPEHLQSGKVLICRKVDENAPRIPQHWTDPYGYLNNPRGNTTAGPVNDSSQRRNNNTDTSFSPLITSTPRKYPNTSINNSISPKKGFIHNSAYRPVSMESAPYADPPKGWNIGNNTPPAFQKQNDTFPSLLTSFSPSPIKIETMTDTPQDGILDYSKFAPPIITSPTSPRFANSNYLRDAPNQTFAQQMRSPNQSGAQDWANDLRNQTRQQEVFQSLATDTIEPDGALGGNAGKTRSPVRNAKNNLLSEQEIINNLVKSSTPQSTQDSFKSLPFESYSNVARSDKGSNSSMNSNRATPSTTTGCTKDLTCTSWSTLPTRCVSTEKIITSTEKFKEEIVGEGGHVPLKKTRSTTSTKTVTTEKITSQMPPCSSNSSIPSCRGRPNLSTINLDELDKIEEQERRQLDHDLRKWQQARRKLATNLAAHCL
ncbi:hypothetical protein PPYR_11821 [Photinus pyralis]|uniref:Uncharacterized protein n=1 Tax=Photinus pyralis TaxID=7054 RepID=A0A5N4ACE8_PHOPY|nr:uncharacterized serine-rich protein C215.13-like isoform X2 [Photinus pyralis]KAB0794982.1 hypothetical protein PPYR_11821 [Photinus pyralis]